MPCAARPVRVLAVHGAARALRAIRSDMELSDVELTFEVHDAIEGGYCAHAVGHSIFTEGETWEELRGLRNCGTEAVVASQDWRRVGLSLQALRLWPAKSRLQPRMAAPHGSGAKTKLPWSPGCDGLNRCS